MDENMKRIQLQRQDYMKKQLAESTFATRLFSIAKQAPEIWRDIKREELGLRQKEQAEYINEEMRTNKDYSRLL